MGADMLAQAFASTAGVLAGVEVQQLDGATPCASWRVRELVNHIVGGPIYFAVTAETWHTIETPRFTVVSQLNERDTRSWADEFNQYIEALKKIVKVDDRLLPRLTVVFFARDKSFT